VSSPTDSPVSSPTDSPVSSPTDSPVSSPTDSPVSSPTDSPVSSPTDSPVSSPTDSPVSSPTDSPVSSPTDSRTNDKFIGASGDPHIFTWGRELFDFHGICDLVLMSNPSFDNGDGLDIHIRNKRMRAWSYIGTAIIRIGRNVLEVAGGTDKEKFWIDGAVQGTESKEHSDGEEAVVGKLSTYDIKFTRVSEKSRKFVINLGIDEAIIFKTWNSFVSINVQNPTKEHFNGSVGLMGNFPSGVRLARDGKTAIEDVNIFGQEWQVNSSEPELFLASGSIGPTEKCSSPSSVEMRRRLGESEITLEEAKIACSVVDDELTDLCIFDVMATNDVSSSGIY